MISVRADVISKFVEKQGEYPSYVSSRFTSPVDLGLSDSKINDVYNSIHDLKKIAGVKTADELRELWEEHFLCKGSVSSAAAPVESVQATVLAEPTTVTRSAAPVAASSSDDDDILDDATVQELLKGLD